MHANKFSEFGPGDAATWPPCMGHPNDPRTPECDEDDALEFIDAAIDWLKMAKVAMINGAQDKARQHLDDALATIADLVGAE